MAYPPRVSAQFSKAFTFADADALAHLLSFEQAVQNPGLHILVTGTQPSVDIIAVHGLAAHPWFSWTKKLPGEEGRAMWLRDFLPTIIPHARVLMFSYDSKYLMNASKTSLRAIGRALVEGIHTQREDEVEKNRPIIFLGHSFGGIVIEEALLYANHRDEYKYLSLATSGILFLGTPHRGSDAASWAKVVAHCAKVLDSDTRLLDIVEKGSDRLESVIDDFVALARQNDMHLVCFYELLETAYPQLPFAQMMIVAKDSASIEGYDSIPLALDHCNLNKFNSAEDDNFKVISGKLKELADISRVARYKKNVCVVAAKQSNTDEVVEIVPGVKLPIAAEALFNSAKWQHDPLCLSGTRVVLLKEIDAWSTDPESSTVYWLCGMAGTGKSTIARSVATTLKTGGQLAASFIFSRGHDDLSNTRKFVTTIAFQLSYSIPTMRQSICDAIKNNPDIIHRGLLDQWSHLILKPLSSIKFFLEGSTASTKPFVLLIDALDECDNEDDIRLIIHLLEMLKLESAPFRVFITSRPEVPIHAGFKSISTETHHDFILHDIEDAIVQNDISQFLHHELRRIKNNSNFNLPEDWPGDENIQRLTHQAGKLFIYSSTICWFIGDRKFDPNKRLSLILSTDTDTIHQSATAALDAMYTTVLHYSLIGTSNDHAEPSESLRNSELSESFRNIVGPIVLLFDPLSVQELAMLLAIDELDVDHMLANLGAVIDARESRKIRLLHPSFRDFLLDPSRCIAKAFQVNKKRTHYQIFINCLKLISSHLKRDICSLRRPGILRSEINDRIIEKCLPFGVQYACRYWVSHLQQATLSISDNSFADAINAISNFFRADILHWIEALSLVDYIREGCSALVELEDMLAAWLKNLIATSAGSTKTSLFKSKARPESNFPVEKELANFAYDAKRFLFYNSSMIKEAPLQTYCGALIFCPAKSKLREHFHIKIPPWLKARSMVPDDWSPVVHVCEDHSWSINAVAFSPDGKLLASASDDMAIRVWDPIMGTCQKTLLGHFQDVRSVVFSPDGKLLASSSSKTIKIWNPKTGTCQKTLQGHFGDVCSLTFLPDGKLLESGSWKNTVRIWDLITETKQECIYRYSCVISAAAFSPDGIFLAAGTYEKKIVIWDLKARKLYGSLEGHHDSVSSVAFSPDSKVLASSSKDKAIKIWDPKTGACLKTMKGHYGGIRSVVWSHNGRLLASASEDKTVRIWDPKTGSCQKTMKAHSDYATSVVFSPDGRLLASASTDCTIRVWDTSKIASSSTSSAISTPKQNKVWKMIRLKRGNGHSSAVYSIAFSPDGKLLASVSGDKTVRIWDPLTGICHKIFACKLNVLQHFEIAHGSQNYNFDLDFTEKRFGKMDFHIYFKGSPAPSPITIDRQWIKWENERLLFLLPDALANLACSSSRNNLFAVGHSTGEISFFEFAGSQLSCII